jgi:sporulation protein YlmC with PRC-barrel domain
LEQLEYKEIEGKEVLGKLAHLIGKVSEIEVDTNTWKVTHICVDIDKNIVEDLGLKKPRIGSVRVTVPTEMINATSDRIILKNETLDELKKVIQPLKS